MLYIYSLPFLSAYSTLPLEWWKFLWKDWYVSHKIQGNINPLWARGELMIVGLEGKLVQHAWRRDRGTHPTLVLCFARWNNSTSSAFFLYAENYWNYWKTAKPDPSWEEFTMLSWFGQGADITRPNVGIPEKVFQGRHSVYNIRWPCLPSLSSLFPTL